MVQAPVKLALQTYNLVSNEYKCLLTHEDHL